MKRFAGIFLIASVLLLPGCGPVIVGTGIAGLAVFPGAVKERIALPTGELYMRCLEVAEALGEVYKKNPASGIIKFKYYSAIVEIQVETLDKTSSLLKIKARNKVMMSESDVARTVYKHIIPDPSLELKAERG